MRILSSPTARSAIVAATVVWSTFSSKVDAISFQSVETPSLQLDNLGRVALVGNFDAISIYEYIGQTQESFTRNGSDSLLARFPNGAFTTLQSADATIETMCSFVMPDGTLAGVVVGGNFTSLGGVKAAGAALYNPVEDKVNPLPGLEGQVNAVLCDQESGTVYFGGSFAAANSRNAIAWTDNWTELPFAGFNGAVTSISKSAAGTIVFGGEFDGLGNTTSSDEPELQVIPVSSGDVTATGSSTTPGFSDPKNIICKTGSEGGAGNTWLAADNAPASWQAQFRFGFTPTKLTLYNTDQDGRGTKTFRFTSLNSGGILNLTYVDEEGNKQYCESRCPLSADASEAQDFKFVNNVGLDGFRIDISEWYGPGAGLAGLELFQNDTVSYAVNGFNEPACDGVSTSASATQTGPWSVTSSLTSNADYLTAQLTGPIDPSSASVVFRPNIKQSGNYSVTVYTPGCVEDGTCGQRGQVQLSGEMSPSGTESAAATFTTALYQTNDYYKYDEIYVGYIDAGGDGFEPTVTLAPAPGQNGPLTIVAQRVQFNLRNSTGGLNGLYEFDPDKVLDEDFSNSAINNAGTDLNKNARINSLLLRDDKLFVAGRFSGDGFNNVLAIADDEPTALSGDGLNNEVLVIYDAGDLLYMGGNFTNTQDGANDGLSGICTFSVDGNSWGALGAGVDGVVWSVTPLSLNLTVDRPETVLLVNGRFSKVLAFGDHVEFPSEGNAIWVPSSNNWLHNLDTSTVYISGSLSTFIDVPGTTALFAGSISSQMLGASGSVRLTNDGENLESFKLAIDDDQESTSSSKRKRAISTQNFSGVTTGRFYEEGDLNITILAGHFTAQGSDGPVQHILFIDGNEDDKKTGISSGIDENSNILALETDDTTLYAGGTVTGNVNGADINGLVVIDLKTKQLTETQPPALEGDTVAVNSIAMRPESPDLFVGGSFDSAGAFDCPALCVFNTDVRQWNSPGGGLTGMVSRMIWTSNDKLVVVGDLEINGQATSIVSYNAKDSTFEPFPDAATLPGSISALTIANSDGSELWAAGLEEDGLPFLMKFDGSEWKSTTDGLDRGTVISGLQVFTLSDDHDSADMIDSDQKLLIIGQLNLLDFGNASAALYDGNKFEPYLLSTKADNTAGYLSAVFVLNPQNFFDSNSDHLATGFVVLIAIAIALLLTFVTLIAGFVAEHIRKKRQGYIPAQQMMFDKTSNLDRLPPEHLLSNVNPEAGSPVARL